MVRVTFVLLSVLPCLATEWGVADHDLRLSAELGAKEIRVSMQNAGAKDLLILVGVKVAKPHMTGFKVMPAAPDGTQRRVIYTALGFIAGAAEPLTIGLLKGETYTVILPLDSYFVLDGSMKLPKFLVRPCKLWIELAVSKEECPNPAKLDSMRRVLPCWYGKAVSNRITSRGRPARPQGPRAKCPECQSRAG